MRLTTLAFVGGAAIAALGSVPALASGGPSKDAFYASDAIISGQYEQAEHALRPASYSDARDPARLINLATVYINTQRFDDARAVLRQVRDLPDESLTLANGASFSSHSIAGAMLNRLP